MVLLQLVYMVRRRLVVQRVLCVGGGGGCWRTMLVTCQTQTRIGHLISVGVKQHHRADSSEPRLMASTRTSQSLDPCQTCVRRLPDTNDFQSEGQTRTRRVSISNLAIASNAPRASRWRRRRRSHPVAICANGEETFATSMREFSFQASVAFCQIHDYNQIIMERSVNYVRERRPRRSPALRSNPYPYPLNVHEWCLRAPRMMMMSELRVVDESHPRRVQRRAQILTEKFDTIRLTQPSLLTQAPKRKASNTLLLAPRHSR